MTLGEQIKLARENRNMSQESLAEQLNVSRQAISKWENNIAVPQGANRETLSKVLELDLSSVEESSPRKRNWLCWLGWITAGIFLILFVITSTNNLDNSYSADSASQSHTSTLSPTLKSVAFYDSKEELVLQEALWYDAARIESILIQWEGGTPDHIKMFATPSGTETTEMTELLLTKTVLDGGSAALLNADTLKNQSSSHVYFELNFGDNAIVSSELYNVFNSGNIA